MLSFILRKLALLAPTFLGVTLVAFGFIRLLPGDPILMLAGERGVSETRYTALKAQYGFDKPLPMQYLSYLGDLAHGNLGRSLVTGNRVTEEFGARFPATVELSLAAMLIALLLGLPLGVLAALKRGTWVDQGIMTISLTGYSMPIFWWGLLLIMLFSVGLGWTPVSGRISAEFYFENGTGFMLLDALRARDWAALGSSLQHLILPAIVLATVPLAVIARQTRSAMLGVLGEDYIRTARAKGLSPWRVVVVHALRNAMITVITVIGLQVGILLTGAILTETIFSWPGIGKWMIDSIARRDYPVVQSGILLIAAIVMLVNLLVDLSYGWFNPRMRGSG